ncbi:hypothetical protein LBW62_18105 [Ralstonia solanacearum]|uniref:hypothetical protein n=1 Tax=Ralstonia solanacearum TaxID=305 RepID=UPI0005C4881A|nr:hypothetical protein [Ralstonia solanacearum]MBB6592975.1 hypothetical protein [Ralstonia solanacearum]MBB6597202.1 hypothetical protein [Ralstonia solanacearum]MDB0527162.1 hypothetical protein [Ralstonia solanacearum]MDB0543121.1 hypothetical protein [Ralstonia solanacearum]MDB0553654.1 hypothetical protein [Ralstonia solanacearum]
MLANRLFRSGLTLLAVFAVVWIATIAWWQGINRMPTTADIVTCLVLLPLGMVIGYRVIKRALDGIRTNVAAGRGLAAAATTAPAATDSTATAADPQDTSRHWRAVLLGSALRTIAGADAEVLIKAAQTYSQPEMTDVQGFGSPIFAAPVEGLDIDDLRRKLAQRHPGLDWTNESLRALTLCADVVDDLAAQAAASQTEHASADPARLIVTALLPRDWTPQQQAAADDWLRQRIRPHWPAERVTLEPIAAKGDADALLLLDRATLALNRPSEERTLRMVVVADSLIGTHAVEQLTQQSQLYDGDQNKHGRLPGEAAAGVLLCSPADPLAQGTQASAPAEDEAPAAPLVLTRASVARLGAPTTDSGRPDTAALGGVVGQVLETLVAAKPNAANDSTKGKPADDAAPASPPQIADIAAIVADTGMHPVRTTEVARVVAERLPALDAAEDVLSLGCPCGYLGAAGALLPVALAHRLSLQTGRPVLALTANDVQQRGAIAVAPSLT